MLGLSNNSNKTWDDFNVLTIYRIYFKMQFIPEYFAQFHAKFVDCMRCTTVHKYELVRFETFFVHITHDAR